jgi:hypothetical protein
MKELWILARRAALGTDKALDDVLTRIDSL